MDQWGGGHRVQLGGRDVPADHAANRASPTTEGASIQAAVGREALEEAGRFGKLPRDLPVGDPAGHEGDVDVAGSDDLVPDVHAVRPDKPRLRRPDIGPNLAAPWPRTRTVPLREMGDIRATCPCQPHLPNDVAEIRGDVEAPRELALATVTTATLRDVAAS